VLFHATVCKAHPTIPRKIESLFEKLTALCRAEFQKSGKDFYLKEFEYSEIRPWLREHILPIEEIKLLNLSVYEEKKGINVDDDNRGGFVVTDRHTTIKEEHDFIDLEALVQNVSNDLILHSIGNYISYRSFYKSAKKAEVPA
jgi:hypothetical protein